MSRMIRLANGLRLLRRLRRDVGGIALIEMAFVAPFLMVLALGGIELISYSTAHMRVSQVAISLADNASRAKQEIVSGVPRMREVDVNEAFRAAELQAGALDIADNGLLILSSLETNADDGQWIHWQRCHGGADYASSYGEEGDGETGTAFPGMGPADKRVLAEEGYAIMFVEVYYDYTPMVFGRLLPDRPIRKTAAMYVRDDRDLSGIYNPAPQSDVRTCD